MNTVLLFEDNQTIRDSFSQALRDRLYSLGAELIVVDETELNKHVSTEQDDQTFEAIILNMLQHYGNVALVIADRDLSQLQNGFSEASISRVCEVMKVPVALYARVNNSSQTRQRVFNVENRLDLTSEFRIVLDANNLAKESVDSFISQICDIYSGFQSIERFLANLTMDELRKGAFGCISQMLEREEYLFDLKRFSSGNTGFFSANKIDASKWQQLSDNDEKTRFMRRSMIYFIGYWLHESLLKYPGVLGNATAVASYLNISEADFLRPEVQDVFISAEYKGPFSSNRNKQWWISDLDKMIYVQGANDGMAFLAERQIKVEPCYCSIDQSKKAGYFCIFTEKPVSKAHSVGSAELPWIPKGAKLSRMNDVELHPEVIH